VAPATARHALIPAAGVVIALAVRHIIRRAGAREPGSEREARPWLV
jgi:hypothetical protein